ncbi:F-box protein CPR1-like [Rutidosis leptorrhynchoides]|uniref:F-box protein CPR1-like n=1 Tax=Rutidosis leptorrhynchoides TaxID=125765 RepID=UPI003A992F6D
MSDPISALNHLPWDLIEAILPFLPPKSLGRFKTMDDYKIISISYKAKLDSDLDSSSVHVYSLRNNSWNKLPSFPYLQSDQLSTLTITAFSLADEKFHEIELPDSANYNSDSSDKLYVFGGKLVAVSCNMLPNFEFRYELWVMEEYGIPKSWKKFCVFQNKMDLSSVLIAQISNWAILLDNNKADEICIYNMDKRRCTSVKIENNEGHPLGLEVYGTYIESLESLERFR